MKRKVNVSIILNGLISLLVLLATIFMFIGFRFMSGEELLLESTRFGVLKFFTVQSNIFMGIVAFIFMIKEFELLKGKIKKIDKKYYILKLIATTSVGLTFFIVFAYFWPISENGIYPMIMNSNLFFHLIVPIISFITFIFYENTNEIKKKEVLYGIIPTMLYGIYYLINVLIHMENGKVSVEYDFYWFVQNGVWTSIIVIPIIFLISYLICLLIWFLNKKRF